MPELADVSENGILHCSSVLLRVLFISDCYIERIVLKSEEVIRRRLLSVVIAEHYLQNSTYRLWNGHLETLLMSFC